MTYLNDPAKAGNAFTMPLFVGEGMINCGEMWRLELKAFGGMHCFDLRRWYSDAEGLAKPSQKGLMLSVKHLPAIAEAFSEAAAITNPGEP